MQNILPRLLSKDLPLIGGLSTHIHGLCNRRVALGPCTPTFKKVSIYQLSLPAFSILSVLGWVSKPPLGLASIPSQVKHPQPNLSNRSDSAAHYLYSRDLDPNRYPETSIPRRGSKIQKGGGGVRTFRGGGGGGSYRNFRSGSTLLQGPRQINKQQKIADSRRGGFRSPPKNTCIRA